MGWNGGTSGSVSGSGMCHLSAVSAGMFGVVLPLPLDFCLPLVAVDTPGVGVVDGPAGDPLEFLLEAPSLSQTCNAYTELANNHRKGINHCTHISTCNVPKISG